MDAGTGEVDAGTEEKNRKLVQSAIANMKEDFARIQVLRNDVARNLVAQTTRLSTHL